jgi:hypothetical protein
MHKIKPTGVPLNHKRRGIKRPDGSRKKESTSFSRRLQTKISLPLSHATPLLLLLQTSSNLKVPLNVYVNRRTKEQNMRQRDGSHFAEKTYILGRRPSLLLIRRGGDVLHRCNMRTSSRKINAEELSNEKNFWLQKKS